MADYRVELNDAVLAKIKQAHINAAIKTANSIMLDVDEEQTVPFLYGTLDQSKFIDDSDILHEGIRILYNTPYAAKQYFVPMNHNFTQHAHATDHWLDPYLPGGTKATFAKDKYVQHFKKEF